MKNKKLYIISALIIIFQLVLVVFPTVYEVVSVRMCEKFGQEYKLKVYSMQIDIYEDDIFDDKIGMVVKNYLFYTGEKRVYYTVNEEGFIVFGNAADGDKRTKSMRRDRLQSGRIYNEDDLVLAEGVTFESIADYLRIRAGENNDYNCFDFDENDTDVYITVKIYGGTLIQEALYIDGYKFFEFK